MSRYPFYALILGSLAATGCAGAVHGQATVGAEATVVAPAPPPASVHVQVSVSFFGVPLDGAEDVVFVLDRSGSMATVSVGASGGDLGMSETESVLTSLAGSLVNEAAGSPLPSKLDAAKDELIHALRAMPDGTRVGVIFFDNEIAAVSPQLLVLDPGTRHYIESFIHGIRPGGSTAAVPAMRLAYQMGAGRVVLLSDGLANAGGSGGDLLHEAREQMQYGVRIDTVGLGLEQDDQLLRILAAESGGLAVSR